MPETKNLNCTYDTEWKHEVRNINNNNNKKEGEEAEMGPMRANMLNKEMW